MKIIIRPENESDFDSIDVLLKEAFKNDPYSDQKEGELVKAIRETKDYIPELSLVLSQDLQVVGYIMFSKTSIPPAFPNTNCVALAPVAVLPEFQNKGFGGQLIKQGHHIALNLGYQLSVVLGHENYYPKFGFKLCSDFGIKLPFDAPKENCMVKSLNYELDNILDSQVNYASPFYY
ncbi:MAG: hypothetical protein BM564_00365 [Bacteroidetes bacterium MedPE-SWsnd-G2]|nr:MAG: hypothetical protein BM564_00365 [Bacteroidetes bacterium MedPE-SWsnd-G2]